jgi:hypothetical protein
MRLHVANISPEVTEKELLELLGLFGEAVVLEFGRRRRSGDTTKTALVEMDLTEGLNAARALNGRVFRRRQLCFTLTGGGEHCGIRA